MSADQLPGKPCLTCPTGVLEAKLGSATSRIPNKPYYACSNWQFHKVDPVTNPNPPKGTFIMHDNAKAVGEYFRSLSATAAGGATGSTAAAVVSASTSCPAPAKRKADTLTADLCDDRVLNALIDINRNVLRIFEACNIQYEMFREEFSKKSKNSSDVEAEDAER
jgi:hypothetical protein